MSDTKTSVATKLVLTEFFNKTGVDYSFNGNKNIFTFVTSVNAVINNVIHKIVVRDDSFTIYAQIPVRADINDDDMMERLSDFICRVNNRSIDDNTIFELDYDDGEIRTKHFIECENSAPSEKIIEKGIFEVLLFLEKNLDALAEVIFKGACADSAIMTADNKMLDIVLNHLSKK